MEELYENIEKYLHGKLPEKEHQAFAERLKQEPELEAEVNAFRLAEDIIEEGIADELRGNFVAWDKTSDQSQTGKLVKLKSFRRIMAIAASLLLLSVFTFLQWRSAQQSYSSGTLAAYYHDADLGINRSASDDANELSGATTALQAENYSLAIQELSAINDTSVYHTDAQFLLADAYYRSNALTQANAALEPVLDTDNTLLREKAEWLEVLITLKAGKKNEPEFLAMLQQISTDTSHSFQPKAAELEATLDKFWAKWVD